MIVEIINVGTELLLGEIVNTNATYLQKLCKEFGFHVYHQTTVGDNPVRLKECLEIAFTRGADCVITTGGLGPTADDLTKEIAAAYLGVPLLYNEEEGRKVKEKYSFVTNGAHIPQNNFKQAFFPKDCYILENDVGTANGCIITKNNKRIINLPGPPKEMQYVVENALKPYLLPLKKDCIYTEDYNIIGIGESKIAEELKEIIEQQKDVSIALYASEQYVRIRLGYRASNKEVAYKKIAHTKDEIIRKIGHSCIQNEDIQKEVFSKMPPYHIVYCSSFVLREEFIIGKQISYDADSFEIMVDVKKHTLGELVNITFKYQTIEHFFMVPLLKKATISYPKLEARILQNLYVFIKEHNL